MPLDIWRTLWQLAQFSKKEYSTLLQIEEQEHDTYRITDWYLPYQSVTSGSVRYNEESALNMVREIGDRWEHYYGVHHVHPWVYKGGPSMSGIDIDEMWDWVSNAGKGIFIVSDPKGRASAVFVTKEGELFYQIAMDLIIDYSLPQQTQEEFLEMFEERVTPEYYRYSGYDYDWPRKQKDESYVEMTDEEWEELLEECGLYK